VRGFSELVTPSHRLRFAASPFGSLRHNRSSASAAPPLLSCACPCCTHVHSSLLLFLLICWTRVAPALLRRRSLRGRPHQATMLQHHRIRVPARSSTASSAPKLAQTVPLRAAGPASAHAGRHVVILHGYFSWCTAPTRTAHVPLTPSPVLRPRTPSLDLVCRSRCRSVEPH
jgi:hypothetical protein